MPFHDTGLGALAEPCPHVCHCLKSHFCPPTLYYQAWFPLGTGAFFSTGGMSFLIVSGTIYSPGFIIYSLGNLFRPLWTCGYLFYPLGYDPALLFIFLLQWLQPWKSFSWHLCPSDTTAPTRVCARARTSVHTCVHTYVCVCACTHTLTVSLL